jgi:hypothetical protein
VRGTVIGDSENRGAGERGRRRLPIFQRAAATLWTLGRARGDVRGEPERLRGLCTRRD